MDSDKQLMNQNDIDTIHSIARDIRKQILADETPSEYIKTKPVGGREQSYVPASYMDDKFKNKIPLYKNKFAFPPFMFQNWIIVGVELEDRTTHNIELGLKAHRIQFKKDKKEAVESGQISLSSLTPFDMVDVGNDVSACLTEAIKNAQSRFGICADIYNKRILSDEELAKLDTDFKVFLDTIANPLSKKKYTQEWKECKTPSEKLLYLQQLTEN